MKTIPLPRTGLTVSQLCLGTNQFGTALDEPRAHEMLDTFRALGGNFIDTAHGYADWIPSASCSTRSSFSARDDHAEIQVPALDDAQAAAKGHRHQARLRGWGTASPKRRGLESEAIMVMGCTRNRFRFSSLMPWKTAEAPPRDSISRMVSIWSSRVAEPRRRVATSGTDLPLSEVSASKFAMAA